MTPSTKTVAPAELWLADIPFTSGRQSKIRPVLILWLDGDDAIVGAVTSAAPRSERDIPLADWQTSGLRVPSTARPPKAARFNRAAQRTVRCNRLSGRTIRTQKTRTIEVDQVGRRVRDPHFGLPGDFPKVTTHERPAREGRDIDQAGS